MDKPLLKHYLPNGEITLEEQIEYDKRCPELIKYIRAIEAYASELEERIDHLEIEIDYI